MAELKAKDIAQSCWMKYAGFYYRLIFYWRCEMKPSLLRLGFLALFLIATQPAVASNPVIVGEISGVELCPQFACDAAVFTGTCDCSIDKRNTPGFFWVSVQHDPLPAAFSLQLF